MMITRNELEPKRWCHSLLCAADIFDGLPAFGRDITASKFALSFEARRRVTSARACTKRSAFLFTGGALETIGSFLRCFAVWLLVWLLTSAAQAQTGTLSGVINTYYPGIGSPSAGSNVVTVNTLARVGAARTLAPCDQVLIIQMIDATINTSNSTAYGSGGTSASGYTALNNSGVYEFATVASISGGSIMLTTNLRNSYRGSGASVFQVVYVPNYQSAALTGTVMPAPWNGAAGGVVALQVQGALNMGGQTIGAGAISATGGTGHGFAGGMGSGALASSNSNAYVTPASGTTNGFSNTDRYGEKGQGIAGIATSYETHWSGARARGAPANGGGGGVDVNSGGGGGGNGGAGGMAGGTWPGAGSMAYGGFGGSAINDSGFTRAFMGGGGGGGQQNNGTAAQYKGGDGGGIVLIRAGSINGSGIIDVSGANGRNPNGIDGGSGGGAGGTILMGVQSGSLAGLTLRADGGSGGPVGTNSEGAGGGGGGGRVITNAGGASVSTAGGAATTNTPLFPNSQGVAGGGGVSTSSAIIAAPSALPTCMRLSKALGSTRRSATDQFTVKILSGSTVVNATLNSTTAGAGAVVIPGTGVTGSTPVVSAMAYTLTEAPSGSTTLLNYLASISCTNTNSGSATTLPSGSNASASFSVTPVAGDNISCTLTNTNTATITLQKTLGGGGRIAASDQFALLSTGSGAPADPVNTTGDNAAITSPPLTFQATPGSAYVLNEAMVTGSASTLAQYEQAVSCTNAGPTNVSALTSLPINVTPAVGDSISCLITNTPKAPKLSLQKALGGIGRIAASDQFTLSVTGSGAPATVTTTGAGTAVTSAVNNVVAMAGTPHVLNEAMAANSASILAAYTQSVTCTNTGPTDVSGLTSLPINVTPAVGDAIRCVITNTPAEATVSGHVFLDNGTSGGVANDGILNGSESPLASVSMRLTDCAATIYASALTDGVGGYSFSVPTSTAVGAAMCVEQTNNPATRVSTGASVGGTALPSGSATAANGGNYTYARTAPPERMTFSWNGTGHANLNFGDVDNSSFAASSAKTARPDSSVTYAHVFTAGTAGQVRFSIASETATPALAGWSTQIFADTGCTGTLQSGAAQLYPRRERAPRWPREARCASS